MSTDNVVALIAVIFIIGFMLGTAINYYIATTTEKRWSKRGLPEPAIIPCPPPRHQNELKQRVEELEKESVAYTYSYGKVDLGKLARQVEKIDRRLMWVEREKR